MKRPQYVFRPNLSDPQHRRAWALLQQVPSAKRKEFLVQAILATEQTDRLEKSIRKVVREELQAVNIGVIEILRQNDVYLITTECDLNAELINSGLERFVGDRFTRASFGKPRFDVRLPLMDQF